MMDRDKEPLAFGEVEFAGDRGSFYIIQIKEYLYLATNFCTSFSLIVI